jgi:hypothetical protein
VEDFGVLTKNIFKVMKVKIKKFSRPLFFVFIILLSALFFQGCATSIHDPLIGWQFSNMDNFDSIKEIEEDYHGYINNLPHNEKIHVGPIQFFEDGAGQRAVRIEIAINGTDWAHVLIYNKENKRIKVIKYATGHYSS